MNNLAVFARPRRVREYYPQMIADDDKANKSRSVAAVSVAGAMVANFKNLAHDAELRILANSATVLKSHFVQFICVNLCLSATSADNKNVYSSP
jgi:hypothetical protein